MAIKVTKEVVCDLGERHSGEIRQWRITVDRESKVFDLCPACSRPLQKLLDSEGGTRRSANRLRVMTMSEIEKQKTPPTR